MDIPESLPAFIVALKISQKEWKFNNLYINITSYDSVQSNKSRTKPFVVIENLFFESS